MLVLVVLLPLSERLPIDGWFYMWNYNRDMNWNLRVASSMT